MKFKDTTQVIAKAGRGGDGVVSFKSAKNAAKLGADGGDGGDGGSVYLVGDNGLSTLSHLRYRQLYAAESGVRGGSNQCTGKRGADLEIKVPLGTVARSKDGDKIGEVLENGAFLLIARGGHRGLGNMRFLKPNHQAPEEYTKGKDGESIELDLELQIIADIGLAGFPNAGKSSLLRAISAAKPKVADYPFTTLVPHIGVVEISDRNYQDIRSYVVADIPGLIEGASEGKGLGIQFLRHLKRTQCIAYVLDSTRDDMQYQFSCLKKELQSYGLEDKASMIIVTKADDGLVDELATEFLNGKDWIAVSSLTGFQIHELKERFYSKVIATNIDDSHSTELEFSSREGFEVVHSSSN
jgi:GTPase